MKLAPTTTILAAALAAAFAAGCHTNDSARAQARDPYGNYQSTARYNAMERAEFDAAMDAGLRDFDEKVHSMELEANALGPDAVEEYHDKLAGLMKERREFDGELARSRAMLEDEWRKHREDVAEKYVDLREELDDVYDDVVDEA